MNQITPMRPDAVDQVLTAKLLVEYHGYHIRAAQRALERVREKLGKDKDQPVFASEFIAENRITFPKGYGDVQRGKRTPDHEKELVLLTERSSERAGALGLIVGVTYEVTYILVGHYEKKVICTFSEYTEHMITAIFHIPDLTRHAREISMPVELVDGEMRPITGERGAGLTGEYALIKAVTYATTIGIPTCSIVDARIV